MNPRHGSTSSPHCCQQHSARVARRRRPLRGTNRPEQQAGGLTSRESSLARPLAVEPLEPRVVLNGQPGLDDQAAGGFLLDDASTQRVAALSTTTLQGTGTGRILFIRGGSGTGGFLEGGSDEQLADINNDLTTGGNHGWGQLADALEAEGYTLEQVIEGPGTAGQGSAVALSSLALSQYEVLVFGSNNAVYSQADVDAFGQYIQNGGAALFISDANFGSDWADAPNSDQQFLDLFGIQVYQDQGTYVVGDGPGEILVPTHPIFNGVNQFDGEGVSPFRVTDSVPGVEVTLLAGAEGNVRVNEPPLGGNNQGSSVPSDSGDASVLIATYGQGRIAGHYDRNTFFNIGGAGTNITRFDNQTYAVNLFNWLAAAGPTSSDVLNFNNFSIDSYGGSNDASGSVFIEDGGTSLRLEGNNWKKIDFPYTVTENTILEFDFTSSSQGEIHGIGFDTNTGHQPNRTFQLYGTQNWGILEFADYQQSAPNTQQFRIRVGDFYQGELNHLFFTNDDDANANAVSSFSNIRIFEEGATVAPTALDDTFTVEEDSGSTILTVLANDDSGGEAVSILSAAAQSSETFTVAVLPDTQFYSETFPQLFNAQTQWIVDNVLQENIQFVSHVGDIVQNGGEGPDLNALEWARADAAMSILDDNLPSLPYGAVLGNHDLDIVGFQSTAEEYVANFGSARYEGKPWYGGASSDQFNHYQTFAVGGREYLHISLEWRPRSTSLQWAQSVIDAHPNIPTILSTHEYTQASGSRSSAGENVFVNLVNPNDQIFLVLSGHIIGEGAQTATNMAGNPVFEVLADYQHRNNGGDGWLRLIEFDEQNDQLNFRTYSPTLDRFETDANSQFSFSMDFDQRLGQKFVGSAGGTITIVGQTIEYQPAPDFFGTETFNYTIGNSAGTDTATVTVNVLPQNDPPTATDDSLTVISGSQNNPLDVLSNDTSFPDGPETLRIVAVGSGSAGGTITTDGQRINYTPRAGFTDTETFTYTINDGTAGSTDTATVTVTVEPDFSRVLNFNDFRVGSYGGSNDASGFAFIEDSGATLRLEGNNWKKIDFPYTVTENTILEFDFTSSSQGEIHGIGFDTDTDHQPDRTFQLYGTQNWGILDFANYQQSAPNTQQFRIRVGDFYQGGFNHLFFTNDDDANANAVSFFSNIQIYEDVAAVPPSAVDDSFTLNEDSNVVSLPVLGNDDDGGASVSITQASLASAGGTVTIVGETIEYQPGPDFFGTETFSYTIANSAGTDTATVTVNVLAVNDPPTAVDDLEMVAGDSQNNALDVLGNDLIAPDLGESLRIIAVGGGSEGGTITTDGQRINYTPQPGFTGTETFTYTIDDGTPGSVDTATVTVIVNESQGDVLNFNNFSIDSYGGSNDASGSVSIEDGGTSLRLQGNNWKKIDFSYTVTENTILEFDFASSSQGEIHGIGFDTNTTHQTNRTFQLYGSQDWGIPNFADYAQSAPGVVSFSIPVGDFYRGDFNNLFFVNDDDANSTAVSFFSNIRIYEESSESFEVVRIASGLPQPLFLTAAPGDDDRLFIVGKSGQIVIYDQTTGSVNATPFLDVSADVSTDGERGLLGMAFHPNYQSNGLFYVSLTNLGGDTEIRQYQVSANPDLAASSTLELIISFAQPASNHNGGWLDFGPDGYLYFSSGDGGGGNDPGNNAQDLSDNLLGKILRLDIDGDDFPADDSRNYAIPSDNPFVGTFGDDEIWAYGLRNAWRPSFDRLTGDLYVADVGQGAREEISVQPASSTGGENYGWRLREGTIATPDVGGPRPPGSIDPVYDYSHGFGPFQGRSVTGGYVYRGPVTQLQGQYFFGDFISDQLWSLQFDGSDPSQHDGTNYLNLVDRTSDFTPDVGTIDSLVSFGEDNQGNLYLVGIDGEVFAVRPVVSPAQAQQYQAAVDQVFSNYD